MMPCIPTRGLIRIARFCLIQQNECASTDAGSGRHNIYAVMKTNLSSVSSLELLNDGPSVFMAAGPIERSGNDFAQFLCLVSSLSLSLLLFFSRHQSGHRIQFFCDWLWGEELRCGNHLFEWGHGHKLGTASPYIKPWQYILLNKSSSGKLENAKKKKKNPSTTLFNALSSCFILRCALWQTSKKTSRWQCCLLNLLSLLWNVDNGYSATNHFMPWKY